jgi:hypothetical protein
MCDPLAAVGEAQPAVRPHRPLVAGDDLQQQAPAAGRPGPRRHLLHQVGEHARTPARRGHVDREDDRGRRILRPPQPAGVADQAAAAFGDELAAFGAGGHRRYPRAVLLV